ncbi:MAG: YifB family Mg chelatase-like AAA ATPase [Parcubacteria group bacterium]|nr:YifB family Mg chelatase-like AAA ATPase [Parcubacteria group bacterium]
MSFAKCYSAQVVGLRAYIVGVEVDISKGLHSFSIVGLPDKSVEESKDRISAAIKNSGLKSPKHKNQKIVISLTPSHIKKEGSLFDLASALAYLLAEGEIKFDPSRKLFLGELSLNGELRPVKGALPLTQKAKELGFTEVYLPKQNAREAAMIEDIRVFGCKTLAEVIEHLDELPPKEGDRKRNKIPETQTTNIAKKENPRDYGFEDVRGQETAKRGLEIAAAGGHNALMYGPPGTGKTMLARAFTDILPELSFDEALETTGIHSISGTLKESLITRPPFRAPHHTSSYVSIIGGGTFPKPGEATLAHHGVLFLDEFPEFEKRVIESLRQPLEEKTVSISRAKGMETFPANFILITAMNPCPCGHKGAKGKECICTAGDLYRYDRKLSGPLMDRIDMWLSVAEVDYQKLSDKAPAGTDTSSDIQKRVERARKIQEERFKNHPKNIRTNSRMSAKDMEKYAPLGEKEKATLNAAAARMSLSPRSYHRIIKLARTIADLDGAENIREKHLLEAIGYREKK